MTNRPITDALAAALAALTPVERLILRRYATPTPEGEDGFSDWLVALFAGLDAEVFELERDELIEKIKTDVILHALEADRMADVDALTSWLALPDPPPGKPWWPVGNPDEVPHFDGGEA
jgi:hypothetical protein